MREEAGGAQRGPALMARLGSVGGLPLPTCASLNWDPRVLGPTPWAGTSTCAAGSWPGGTGLADAVGETICMELLESQQL